LNFQKPEPGTPLSQAEAAQLRAALAVHSQMILPPGELVFPDSGADPLVQAQKESALLAQDPNAYALMMDVRRTCKRPHPRFDVTATFPTDSPITSDDLEIGDKFDLTAAGSLLGSDCISTLSGNYGEGASVSAVDHAQKTIQAEGHLTGGIKAIMTNRKYSNLLGTRGIVVSTNLKGLGMIKELGTSSAMSKALVSFNLDGSYLSLTQELPYTTSVHALVRTNPDKSSNVEYIIDTQIRLDSMLAHIIAHAMTMTDAAKNQSTTLELYLNGNPVSEQQLQNLLGQSAQTATGKSELMKNLTLK
jgi:hypothetical protein